MKSKRATKRNRGQALIEMACAIIALVWLSLGMIEFGRMLMITNMVTHATRDGARAAAVVPRTKRCASNGHLTAAAQTDIVNKVTAKLSPFGITGLAVAVTNATAADGTPIVTVGVTGGVPWIMQYMATFISGSGSQAL